MERDITPERTANSIMQDSSFRGLHLIVEGKKDLRLYKKFIFEYEVRITPAFGNEKVKKVLEILDERGFRKTLGIIDADFKRILNLTEKVNGLFITDDHDSEVMMIKTKALENLINIYCNEDKVREFEKLKGISIREALFALGKEIGYLKLANKVYDLGLIFKPKDVDGNQIQYADFTCKNSLDFLGIDKLMTTAINYSTNKSKNIKNKTIIKEKLLELSQKEHDLFQLVNGHDLSNFLYILIKKILKSKVKGLDDSDCVENNLILAFEHSYFKETDLYNDIVKWSKENDLQVFK